MQQCWIELDSKALRETFQQLAECVGGKEKLAPVIKANAYGHGLTEIYHMLEPENPKWLCVNYVDEARRLRELGFGGRIVVCGPAFAEEFSRAADSRAEIFLGDLELLKIWQANTIKPKLHLKFDTGLSRQGFALTDVTAVQEAVQQYPEHIVGVCTHFANVEDVLNPSFAKTQLERFEAIRQFLYPLNQDLVFHAASSASSLLLPESRYDLCRVGISLYGFWPSAVTRLSYAQQNSNLPTLQPVLSWRARVSQIKNIKAGSFIGYGCTVRASRDMHLAVLPVGYYEGFPRLAGDQPSFVLIRGKRCPIVGRVCMNMMTVDVTHIPDLKAGEQATLIGRDGDEYIAAEDLANWAHSIQYEIVARLNPTIPRKIAP